MIALISLIVALILAALTLAILVLAGVGARRENPGGWVPIHAPNTLAGLARRVLGLYVRRPSRDVPEPQRKPARTGEPR